MVCVSSTIGEGIAVALLTGQGETGNAAELDESDVVKVSDSYDQHYQPDNGATFVRKADHQAGTSALPRTLRTNPIRARRSVKAK